MSKLTKEGRGGTCVVRITGEEKEPGSPSSPSCVLLRSILLEYVTSLLGYFTLAITRFRYTKEIICSLPCKTAIQVWLNQDNRKSFCVQGQVLPFFATGILPPKLHRS